MGRKSPPLNALRLAPSFLNLVKTNAVLINNRLSYKLTAETPRSLQPLQNHPSNKVLIYDTTLRDGIQRHGIACTLQDKIKIAHKLAQLHIPFIEAGWPGANDIDTQLFKHFQKNRVVKVVRDKTNQLGPTRGQGRRQRIRTIPQGIGGLFDLGPGLFRYGCAFCISPRYSRPGHTRAFSNVL